MKIKKYSTFFCATISSMAIIFLTLSLMFYHSDDPSFTYYNSMPLTHNNQLGTMGAQSAALLVYLFGGYGAYIFLLLATFFIFYVLFSSHVRQWDRIGASIVGLLAAVGWCSFYNRDMVSIAVPGGLLGVRVATLFTSLFDPLGAQILLHLLLFSAIIIAMPFPFLWCMQIMQRWIIVAQYLHQCLRPLYYMIYGSIVWSMRFLYGMFVRIVSLITPISHGNESLEDAQPESYTVSPEGAVEENEVLWHTFSVAEQEENNDVSFIATEQVGKDDRDTQYGHYEQKEALALLSHQNDTIEKPYRLPSKEIFIGVTQEQDDPHVRHELEQRAHILEEKLERFGVCGTVTAIKRGPVVTLFEYQPDIDSKISKIMALEDDLALALQALSIRIIAPIPGRSVVGFEVANKHRKNVLFSTLVQSNAFEQFDGALPLVLGEDTVGAPVFVDLVRMPHLLIAGSTGSGKSVALNTMLISLLCTKKPQELTLILIDPKRLEFAPYADIAHLAFPIVTDAKKAVPVLRWVVKQMEDRYELMAHYGARNIFDYHAQKIQHDDDSLYQHSAMPFIVVVIDELSDLMMLAGKEAEELITRIAQMARAAGIHLIVATQRPSVDVITGLIKVNFPSRISFRVTSKIDSRTILDCSGADKLLGRGDMLFLDSSASLLKRVHGAYVSDEEINHVVTHIKSERAVVYEDIQEIIATDKNDLLDTDDELYQEVINFLDTIDEISISLLQRRFRIGYNRSARIIDTLESEGLILPAEGSRMRKVVR